MSTQATNESGSLVLRGVVTILFGAAAVFWPDLTLRTLVFLFSAFILVNGVVDLVGGVGRLVSGTQSILTRLLMVVWAGIEIGVGVYLLRHTYVRLSVFILLVGFTLLVSGVLQTVSALFEEGPSGSRLLMVVIGALTALAGVVMLFQPVASGIAFVWVLGVYALIAGPLMIALASEQNKS